MVSRRDSRSWVRRAASRVRGRSSSIRSRIDVCWLLADDSVCIDGWLIEADGVPGAVDARIVQAGRTGAWSPLLRKPRPDVAELVLRTSVGQTAFGVVGYVAGPIDSTRPALVDLRVRGRWVRVPLPDLRADPVPEEAFSGLVVDYATITPQTLAPVVGVARSSMRPPDPVASVAYRHDAMSGRARVGIVVPVYGNSTYVRNLLRALADGHVGIEVTIVCDDPSLADDLVHDVRSWNEAVFDVPVQVLTHDRNGGFAAACDTGWRAIESAVVLLLNSDVLLTDASSDLHRLADLLTGDVAAVGPVLLFPDGTLQHAGMEMVDVPDFPGFVLPGHPGKHGPADGLPHEPYEVPMLTGAAICVRREVLDLVGGVPRVYGRGDFEDVLLSLALRERGRLVVAPSVRWTHMEGSSYLRDTLGGAAVTLAKSVVVEELTGGRR